MAIKGRLDRLAKRRPRPGGWTVGYADPDDLVTVGDQVMTRSAWNDLDGNKVLVVYQDESNGGAQ